MEGDGELGEMSEQQRCIKEAKAPLAWLSKFPNLHQATEPRTKMALCSMRKAAGRNVKTHISAVEFPLEGMEHGRLRLQSL